MSQIFFSYAIGLSCHFISKKLSNLLDIKTRVQLNNLRQSFFGMDM